MELTVKGTGEKVRINNVICMARTYAKHAEELNNEVPADPIVFMKPNSCLIGEGEEIVIPDGCTELHHEVELAVVLKKGGRNIPKEQALDHVLGYGIILDITARCIQSVLKEKRLPWCYAKGFDTFGPISEITPAEDVPDVTNLDIELKVNGETRQKENSSMMMWGVAEIISWLSRWIPLTEGDVIATGTPGGVGPLDAGDETVATISHVGVLRNRVVRG